MTAPLPPETIALEPLLARLREGASAAGASDLRAQLGLPSDVSDANLGRALVRAASQATLAAAALHAPRSGTPTASTVPFVMASADSSFLGQLSIRPEGRATPSGRNIDRIDDVHTLLAVLRAGTLAQRRAAARRLARRLSEGRDLSAEAARAAAATLAALRDVEIAFEVARAREALPGAPGREARQETEEFSRRLGPLTTAIDAYWSGQSSEDPIAALPPDERAELMVRMRDAPDVVARHVSSVLEGSDGSSTRAARAALLSSLRYAGDARLVPSLLAVLGSRDPELAPEAARALAHVEDPRAHPALTAAFDRSVHGRERALLAGSLGLTGDVRGREHARQLVGGDDEQAALAAAWAMESLATAEDADRLVPLLKTGDLVLAGHAVRALARTGSARALLALAEFRAESVPSGLLAEVEEAERTIRSSMELRGEEPPVAELERAADLAARTVLDEASRDPAIVRFRSWFDFAMANFWLVLGAATRAIARLEQAATRRPGWAAPLAALALHHARHDRSAQALGAFRRALDADRRWVERQTFVVRPLARAFLRRAEEVERAGRLDIARGLVDEALALDLRRVQTELRFELGRRQERLRVRGEP